MVALEQAEKALGITQVLVIFLPPSLSPHNPKKTTHSQLTYTPKGKGLVFDIDVRFASYRVSPYIEGEIGRCVECEISSTQMGCGVSS